MNVKSPRPRLPSATADPSSQRATPCDRRQTTPQPTMGLLMNEWAAEDFSSPDVGEQQKQP